PESLEYYRLFPFRSMYHCLSYHRDLPSFPTRRSSDLCPGTSAGPPSPIECGSEIRSLTCYRHFLSHEGEDASACTPRQRASHPSDRKSTRLNSSHDQSSYAGFCLKKKNAARHLLHAVI